MPHTHCSLACIDAGSVQIEFELGLVRLARQHSRRLGAETRLANAEDRLSVAAEFALDCWNARWPQRRVPIRVYAIEILNRVQVDETVQLKTVILGFPRQRRHELRWRRFTRKTECGFHAGNPRFHLLDILDRLSALLWVGEGRGLPLLGCRRSGDVGDPRW